MRMTRARSMAAAAIIGLLLFGQPACAPQTRQQPQAPKPEVSRERSVPRPPLVFAVIGDYGSGTPSEREVADLVASWDPWFVVTTGDDYYATAGGRGLGRYDDSTGAYYCRWLKDVAVPRTCPSAEPTRNAFFPALGNHDYSDATPSPATYLDYFTLPGTGYANSSGNERYYDFIVGDVHFFVLNSNPDEPDGTAADSAQAQWLKAQLAASSSRYNVVCDHHPPYSSDNVHGSTSFMQWPFAEWGADVVLSGHAHVYERIASGGIVYLINGLGGANRYAFGAPVAGSAVRFDDDWGAQRVTVTESAMTFEFFDTRGELIDSYELSARR